ncbi:MAG: transcription termination/antitermination protein NusA, partial [Paludibacteraceae bacterium]|nr:transcription termination/antitermination protein NusA [Paludibacteraceae bacterium]
DEARKHAEVCLKPEEVSMAIGKGGMNIRLAIKLTGYDIEVFRDIANEVQEEDIYLDEFNDEIEQWIIDVFKELGYDTAKSVLAVSRDELLKATDLEEETIDHVIEVLRAEFE